MNVNTGIIHALPDSRVWRFGHVTGARKDRFDTPDWSRYVPEGEPQCVDGVELAHCVSESSENALEILMNRKRGVVEGNDRSVRHLAVASGTGRRGNTYYKVAETVRKIGVCRFDLLRFPDPVTWEGYYDRTCLTGEVEEDARWRNCYHPQYEWVSSTPDGRSLVENIESALYYAPVVACNNYHSVVILASDGDDFRIFDSYKPFVKNWPKKIIRSAMIFTVDDEAKPSVELPNDSLVFETGTGRFGLHVNGKMFVDSLNKLLGVWGHAVS